MQSAVVGHNHRHASGIRRFNQDQTVHRQRLLLNWPCAVAGIVFRISLSSGGVNGDDTIPVWNLTQGQQFTVRSSTRRITELQVGEHRQTTDVADHMIIHYTLSGYDRRGFAHFEARIKSLDRTTTDTAGSETTDSLIVEKAFKDPTVTVVVGDHGNEVKIVGTESVLRSAFPQADRVLKEICGHDVFQSWFDLPFRIPVKTIPPTARQPAARQQSPDDTNSEQSDTDTEDALHSLSKWTRRHAVSLGLPGTVQCDCACSIDSIKDFEAQFSLTGTARWLPRESSDDESLAFNDFQLTASDVSGTGTILMDQLTGLPQSIQMTQNLSLEGQSIVTSGEKTYEFQFKQSLTQTSIASEFKMQELHRGVPISRQ
jgi:hypothetical protein